MRMATWQGASHGPNVAHSLSGAPERGRRGLLASAALVALLGTAAQVSGQVVTVPVVADATIEESSPNKSFGAQPTLVLKEGGDRVLVRFDPAAIAAAVGSASLASATLRLYIGSNNSNWGPTGRTVDVYRLDAAWSETGVTWNCPIDSEPGNAQPDCGTQWSGGTIEDEATDTIVVTNTTQGWAQFDVTADVLAFLAGTVNDGWLLEKTDEGQAGRVDLVSREGTPGLAPQLVLVSQSTTYDTVPPLLAITAPNQPVLVNTPSPAIAVTYSDAGSGVDTPTLHILLDGQDQTAGCAIAAQSASCAAPSLAAGSHTITASVSDHAGNVASASMTFLLVTGPGAGSITLAVAADTFITGAAPDKEHGRGAALRVSKSGPSRALVSFDLSPLVAALATGSQLVSAQLEMSIATNANNWGAAGRTVGAYALSVPWAEAAATWDCPVDTNLGNNQPDCALEWYGGTFAASATATALITRNLAGTVDLDVTPDVAAMLAGAGNDGWVLKKTDETMSGRVDFVSREAASGTPAQLVVVFQAPAPLPTVSITSPADGSYTRSATVLVTGQAGGSATAVTVNGQPASLGQGGVFAVSVTLSQGPNSIVAMATDAAGDQATATVGVILDTTPPTLTLSSPAAGTFTNQTQVSVTGASTDNYGVAAVTVNGQAATLAGDQFSTTVQLAAGTNQIVVTATDLAGNTQTVAVSVTEYSVPVVAITSPADLSYVNATTVTVIGTVNVTGGGSATVSVNGVAANVVGSSFTASGVPLIEGGNTLTATASDGEGHVGTSSINVVRDLTPPHVAIYTPAAGTTVSAATVVVAGLVNDIVAGTVNAANATVTVNGQPATVANRSFVVSGVPLQPGTNVLTATATDAAGNQAQATVTIRQATPAGARIAIASGNGQSAPVGTPLAQPLVALLLDGTGQPVVGTQVLFQAVGTDGTFDNGRRTYAVASDVAGHATVHFTVGSRAGAGNQLVQASSPGFSGPVQFVLSGLPGAPALIVVDSGDQQQGVAGQALPLPLVAVVVDASANRLPGVAVTFNVVRGAGTFANGQQTLSVASDSDGRVIASLTTDPAEGVANNVVAATIDGLAASPVASFTASALAAFDPSQTSISGVVLDNSNQPVTGATIRILGTALTTVTDTQGLFQVVAAPVGSVTLVVDGSTVQSAGSWPQLELNLTTIPGRNNSLRMPVYLLPLNLASGVAVDETHGGTLTLPQLPGFALTIQPGSVTFPGGGHSGTVSVTVVHSDKVPMVPNFGQQPRLIVTIQPAGAQFSPPATLSMPNVEGMPAGKVIEFYSFDHDLGHFVSIGPGTVSDDSTVVTSNVGVGIVKAGWHCDGAPQSTGSPNACPTCTQCTGSQCAPQPLCQSCGANTACDGQGHCDTGVQLLPQICSQVSMISTASSTIDCGALPKAAAQGFTCGAAMRLTYERLNIANCGNIDLNGATLHEVVESVHGCTNADPVIGTCTVSAGNILGTSAAACTDTYYLCASPAAVPSPPYTCTQQYTQNIYVGSCLLETHVIKITITNSSSAGCQGAVTRD